MNSIEIVRSRCLTSFRAFGVLWSEGSERRRRCGASWQIRRECSAWASCVWRRLRIYIGDWSDGDESVVWPKACLSAVRRRAWSASRRYSAIVSLDRDFSRSIGSSCILWAAYPIPAPRAMGSPPLATARTTDSVSAPPEHDRVVRGCSASGGSSTCRASAIGGTP